MIKNIFIVLATLAFLFLYLKYIERKALYIPFREITETPKSKGLDYRELSVKTPDQQVLNAWFIPSPAARGTLLFLHGNGGNLSHRLEKISLFHEVGLNVFIVDYRGYGKSSGRPSEAGLYRDAQAAYDHVVQKLNIPAAQIVVYGESLGAAVALNLAAHNKIAALILEGAFTNVRDMAHWVYPFLPTIFLSAKYDSLARIKDIRVPILFIHSRNDEIVPFALGQELFEAALPPKEFVVISGGHNDAFFNQTEIVRQHIKDFIHASGR